MLFKQIGGNFDLRENLQREVVELLPVDRAVDMVVEMAVEGLEELVGLLTKFFACPVGLKYVEES